MSAILAKYGSYTVEPGTLLFRQAANSEFYDSMFFGFCTIGTLTSNVRSDRIQVWKAMQPITSVLMVKAQRVTGEEPMIFSAIVDIYNEYFPDEQKQEHDDLILKKEDSEYRRRIVRLLKDQGIGSWVCSVEDNYPMELFLFSGKDKNRQLVSYIESFDTFPRFPGSAIKYYPNSFDYRLVSQLPQIRKS